MATVIDAQTIRRWIQECARVLAEQRQQLTDLDAAIGDADYGANMDRGFKAAATRIESLPANAPPGSILRTVGMALMSTIGGSSGPLWGSAFRRAGQVLGEAAEIDGPTLAEALDQGVQAMQKLGGARVGDKTMIDALAPAVEALRAGVAGGSSLRDALTAARTAAEVGRDSTVQLQARKGRASYLGERSVGHVDAGATSAVMLLKALEEAGRDDAPTADTSA